MVNNERKRILIIIPSFGAGGAERVGVTLINSFDEHKYDLFVITFEDKNDYFLDIKRRIDYVCLRKNGFLDFFRLVFDVREIILKFRPSVILSLLHYFNLVSSSASILVRKNFTLILCEHIYHRNFTEKSRFGFIKKIMMKFLYQKADTIVAISTQMKQALIEDFRIQNHKIKVIYNPIPIKNIKVLGQQDISHHFFKENKKIIISVGRLNVQKRFDRLLKAFSLVRSVRNDVLLIILGQGPLLNELQSLAEKLGISKEVDFVGFQSNPFAWMTKADFFVLTSDYEGFPMVLIEAMACGLPVISTDCPSGPREIIINDKNGFLVPLENLNALTNSMIDILSIKGMREMFSTEALKTSVNFDQQEIFSQYERLWDLNN